MTVKDIFEFLNQKFPTDTACSFDNVGILVGSPDKEVKKALITLDCTMDSIAKATDRGCELIITHHPVIFEPLKNVLKGSIVYALLKNNLAVISMHTNLDVAKGGVNDCLCNAVFSQSGKKVTASDGYVLNMCSLSPVNADDLALLLKTKLGGVVKYTNANKPITNLLVCSGSGGGYITEAENLDCDALLTADVKHNQFLDAERLGISLFDAGHFNTEDIVIEPLKELLSNQFGKIEFITTHYSSIKYA